MTFHEPSTLTVVAFLVIVAAVVLSTGAAVARARPGKRGSVAAGLVGWLVLTALPPASGVLEAHPFPLLMVFFLLVNGAALAAALSPLGGAVARGTPLPWLVAFQSFRLPLELVLHRWVEEGTIPGTMTWTGQNPDILTGVLALAAAPLAHRQRAAAWAFNIAGLLLLLNVARVAVMSSPLPFAWNVEPPLQLVFHVPYAWIAGVCVAGALAGHVVLFRALLRRD